jgi:hypothetical protein
MNRKPTAYEYLVSIVTKVNTNVCIVWPFHIDKGGYGRIMAPKIFGERQQFLVHRLAYRVAYGKWPTPNGLHSCDNRACFNPRHISPGTLRENTEDMVAKDRQAKGERTALSKLTYELVEQARREYIGGLTCEQLATRYGVSGHTMNTAISGKTWKHVPNPVRMRPRHRPPATHCSYGHPLTEGNFYTIRRRRGVTCRECKICSSNKYKIRKLKRGK